MDAAGAGEILKTLTGMAGAAKAVAETVKVLKTKVKGNQDAERAASEAFEKVLALRSEMLDLQEKVLSLQQQMGTLQSENMKLREEIGREQKRTADLKQFQRKQVGRSIVMVREGEPDIYYCPACLARHEEIPLQGLSDEFEELGSHQCSGCQAVFQLKR